MNGQPRSAAGAIWIAAAAILITMIVSDFFVTAGLGAWILAAITLVFAMGATVISAGAAWAQTQEVQRSKRLQYSGAGQEKAKRGGENLAQMMNMLDDEDVDDLRERIKQRLMDQIETGDLEDIESFEQLLASRDRLKRK